MTKFRGISKIKKDKANKIKEETDLINDYKNAISIHFNNVISEKYNAETFLGGINVFYYMSTITNYSNYLNKKIKADSVLCTIEGLETFNIITTNLLIDIVQFFIGIKNYDSANNDVIEKIRLSKISIDEGFKKLSQFDIKIQNSSVVMKDYCLKVIKESIYFLYNSIHIDIEKCLLKSCFDQLKCDLQDSTSIADLDFKKKKEIKKTELTFFDYLNNVNDPELFANDLKESFKIETNTEIAIVIHVLESEQIFVYSYFAGFYRELKKFFDRNIGKQNTINDAVTRIKSGTETRTKSFNTINSKVKELINKHKIKLNS